MRQNSLLVIFFRKAFWTFVINVLQAKRIKIVLDWLNILRLLQNTIKNVCTNSAGLKRRYLQRRLLRLIKDTATQGLNVTELARSGP